MSSGRHNYSSSSRYGSSSSSGQKVQYQPPYPHVGGKTNGVPNGYNGHTSNETIAKYDNNIAYYENRRDEFGERLDDIKRDRDQKIENGRSHRTIKKANKRVEKFQGQYEDRDYDVMEARKDRREAGLRREHEGVVRNNLTRPKDLPDDLNPPFSKYSYVPESQRGSYGSSSSSDRSRRR